MHLTTKHDETYNFIDKHIIFTQLYIISVLISNSNDDGSMLPYQEGGNRC